MSSQIKAHSSRRRRSAGSSGALRGARRHPDRHPGRTEARLHDSGPKSDTAFFGWARRPDSAGPGAHRNDDANGELLYLTVTVSNRDPNLYRWLFAKLDPDTDVSKKQSVIGGCASYAESNRLAVSAMGQSQETAKAVALRRLGYTIDNDAGPVQVVDVICGGPSEGKLELGDQISTQVSARC